MQTFTERLELVIEKFADGNRSKFARLTSKKPSHITDYFKGRTKPTFDYLVQLSNLFSINLHWLLIGDGEMHSDVPERKDFVYVPRYDVQASAGYGTLIESEQIVDHLAFKKDWLESDLSVDVGDLALITVDGDSMEPTLFHGDLILLDLRENRVSKDGIYVVRFDGVLMAKRLQRVHNSTLHVISDNQSYRSFSVQHEEMNQLQIVGKVVWFGRRT